MKKQRVSGNSKKKQLYFTSQAMFSHILRSRASVSVVVACLERQLHNEFPLFPLPLQLLLLSTMTYVTECPFGHFGSAVLAVSLIFGVGRDIAKTALRLCHHSSALAKTVLQYQSYSSYVF